MAPGAEQQELLATAPDPEPAPVAGPRSRVRLTVAYDGAGFHGFWPNAGVTTVGGTLQEVLARVLDQPVTLTCAGRTDAGVHAWGQVVTFDVDRAEADLDLPGLQHALNGLCGPAIAVREAAVVPADFDARSSATARVYRYTVLNRPVPDPFLAAT
ncbi:MAG: tRNA pseudouridine synthase A, partial [Acidimicrobiales bacterium]|nr:tRNA pseudouridine synthase A [Acidimicrobiales bacterium]